jgi:hypothetical protein
MTSPLPTDVPVPAPRWGVRFTADPTHDLQYLQDSYDESTEVAKRGELFINEPKEELYYVGGDGIAHRVGDSTPVPFDRIDFMGIREFDNDEDASNAVPPVVVGGLYHTDGSLRIRLV